MLFSLPLKRMSIFFSLFIITLLLNFCSPETKTKTENHRKEKNSFGLAVDSLIEVRGTIGPNETLTDILLPHSVSYEKIQEIAAKSKDIFFVRRFKAGDDFVIYAKWDSVETVNYFIYMKDPVNYVVFDLRDSVNIYEGQKHVTVKQNFVSGEIQNSLYATLESKNADPNLVSKLADVFAWQIDFYRIQKGDNFKVYYEEEYVDGQLTGIGKILAASFNHINENYYAFYFKQDSTDSYFDEKGQSVRKAFLKAPLKFSRITSRYSSRRFHPVLKNYRAHLGTDYAAPAGTPILSVGDGVVTEARYTKYNGNYVKIKHNSSFTTQYLHMSKIGKGMRPGARVRQGEVIGYVGSTGLATGPHVCFRFWKNGRQVDPLREKIPPSKPVRPENKEAFSVVMNEWIKKLNGAEEKDAASVASLKADAKNPAGL